MLAKHMGITLDQVITMGDAGNDLHMIECAGMGVAMGNAFEEIKKDGKMAEISQKWFGEDITDN